MSKPIVIAKASEIAEESVVAVEVEGRRIALYHLEGGEFRATDDVCTHGQAFLSEGWITDGGKIECPLHGGCFDIRTGEPTMAPCERALRTYRVERDGDDVVLMLEDELA